ncbi:hypothetical protein BLS_000081 [Venturia inaequalis]|uniref:Phytocyanin domain-containing protein n=1 Tax=Venturia inaequalis TaxID=5025 RepID=A0A8H3VDN3_VENIN|nr:hypothetical protein EG328_011118 [Venturia inaequalis]KAE9985054.1 hypothetical protein BLS_000081 [Venturia inaequalis]KAE9989506.1 hypothetical protein EG327_002629 [Venturia inaequalis]RDI84588.1 E3 ubiquitin-protein ligase [Venturia inaequalis]
MVNILSLLALVSGAIAATITVEVGQGGQDTFSPSTVKAAVGDIVTFKFDSRHDVAQGPFNSPCTSASGIYSGIMSSGEFSVKINSTDPIWYYCSVNNHCQNGMVGVINPPSSGDSLSSYSSAAAKAGRSVAGSGVSGGIVGTNGASLFGESGSASSTASGSASSASSAASSASSAVASSGSAAASSASRTSSAGTSATSSGASTATSSAAADHVKAFGYAGIVAIAAAIVA